ncbi:MAG: M20 family metallo-hydrolase [Alphaproteobacteria bacterium]|nr:M20 family metallo-hydrolase [Alphaproteobacteria bacterium]
MDDTSKAPGRAAEHVDESRLWQRHMDMARLGATPKGGVRRLALDDNDNKARALLVEWGKPRGFTAALDPIGNLFIRRSGSEATAAPVLSGSHTDTQPSGGRFDGIYGVLAAFEALEAIDAAGIVTRRPIEAAVWTCEEGGARFPTGTMGSSAFAGHRSLDLALADEDGAGTTVAEALKSTRSALPGVAERPLGFEVAAFVEAHIEQGPILEAEGKTIGIVTGIQGARRFRIEIDGEDGHAGTMPHRKRRDALKAAVSMIHALEALFDDPNDVVRFTIGRLVIKPDAPAVIPGHAMFTIDFRHPEEKVLARLGDQVAGICAANRRGCEVKVVEYSNTKPILFSGLVPDAIGRAARRQGLSHMAIHSGAGHDAMHLFHVAPTGMIFVPCWRGISHNETEDAKSADLAAGARVLAEVLVDLANR